MAYTHADYEIKATYDGTPNLPAGLSIDDVVTGPGGNSAGINVWYAVSSDLTWELTVDQADVDGTYIIPVDFTIRNKHTLEIVSTTQQKFILQMNVADGYVFETLEGRTVAFNVDKYNGSNGNVAASIKFKTNGTIVGAITDQTSATVSGTQVFTSKWYNGIVDSSLYSIKATVASTDAAQTSRFGGSTSLQSLSSDREWTLTLPLAATDGNYDRTFTFEIVEAANPSNVVATTSGVYGFDAFVTDQDAAINDTLVGDDVSLEIDEFGTGGSATVSITFGTDGSLVGATEPNGQTTVGNVDADFTATWADFTVVGSGQQTPPTQGPAGEPDAPEDDLEETPGGGPATFPTDPDAQH